MKRLFFLMLLFAFGGCVKTENKDDGGCPLMFWDFVNYNIAVSVVDPEGNDLLDPNTPGNLRGNKIAIMFGGMIFDETDPVGKVPETPPSRFNMPHWNGLQIREISGRYYLLFGEFSPAANYQNASYTIDWGDGTSDKVSFDLYITWHDCDPTVHHGLRINDKTNDAGIIVKNPV